MSNPTKSLVLKLGILVFLCFASFIAWSISSGPMAHADAVGKLSGKKLKEASGMVVSRRDAGIFWVHNDGGAKRLYAIKASGAIVGSLSLKSLPIDDLEDIATGPGPNGSLSYLYLGDIGDNDQTRDIVRVLRLPEPALPLDSKREPAEVETFSMRYPDGKHDAEALLVDPLTGDLFVVTKGDAARVYTVPAGELRSGQTVGLKRVTVLPHARISAGDISFDGRRIVLRSEKSAWVWHRETPGSVAEAFSNRPSEVPVIGPPTEPNGEAIAFDPTSRGYYTLSEGEEETIYHFANVIRRRSPP